jgi:hypothetical protein
MYFDFKKMTGCDEPFYGVVPNKAVYPVGRVCLPITFGTKENFRTEYLTFEVADFRSSYHVLTHFIYEFYPSHLLEKD